MGFFSKASKALKKAVSKTFKFTGNITGTNWLLRKSKVGLQSLTGTGALKDMAASQEATLQRQSEAAKLDSMNEVQNVTQFDDGGGADFTDGGSRRKKRQSGAFSSGIGLNY